MLTTTILRSRMLTFAGEEGDIKEKKLEEQNKDKP